VHVVELPYPPGEALRAVLAAAGDWGAEIEPLGAGNAAGNAAAGQAGRLSLPVVAGLRRGVLSGPLAIEANGGGSRVVFRPETQDYYLETSAIAVLVMAAAGALLTVVWPLVPKLLPAAPFGAVLALSGWFLVLTRLRAKGPAEFLQSVKGAAGQAAASGGSADDRGAGNSPSFDRGL
jgi:hypothetical protein